MGIFLGSPLSRGGIFLSGITGVEKKNHGCNNRHGAFLFLFVFVFDTKDVFNVKDTESSTLKHELGWS